MNESHETTVADPSGALSPKPSPDAPGDPSPEPALVTLTTAARSESPETLSDRRPGSPAVAIAETSAADQFDGGVESHLWLRRADQLFLGLLAAVTLALMLWHWGRLGGWGLKPVEIERLEARRFDYQIDVNTATWVEWIQLDSIGETLAQRIIDDREQRGPFRSIDDLQRVRGIGPKTVEKIRPWLRVEPPMAGGENRGGH